MVGAQYLNYVNKGLSQSPLQELSNEKNNPVNMKSSYNSEFINKKKHFLC